MTTVTGQVRVDLARVIEFLGKVPSAAGLGLAEYVENGLDAGANEISIILEPNRILITDNGHGMVPGMLPDDKAFFTMFLQDIEEGTYTGYDIRTLLNKVSLMSMEWMMQNIAFSAKLPQEGKRGLWGVGTQAFRQIADKATWYSRPSASLAKAFWGIDRRAVRIPVLELTPPTAEQLQRRDLGYTIKETEVPLLNHRGTAMISGTKVEICQLKPGIEANLRPAMLAEQLRASFGEEIRGRHLTLTIVDRVTEEGRRTKNGKEILVEPSVYRGILIVQETMRVSVAGVTLPFEAELFFDPRGRDSKPMLRRGSRDVRPLVDLEEFNRSPWNAGNLTGFVTFPQTQDESAVWSADKTTPLAGPTRNHWQKTVWQLAQKIEEAIAEIDARARDRHVTEQASRVVGALMEAVKKVDTFQDLLPFGVPERPRKVRKSAGRRTMEKRTIATVLNEHNRGVDGITIQLISAGHVVAEKVTGASGAVSFGRQEHGHYRLQIVPPKKGQVMEPRDYIFTLGSNMPGIRCVFHIHLGVPKPEQRKLSRISIWTHALDDPDRPYDASRLPIVGIVDINSEYEPVRRAIEGRDDETLDVLMALYTALAITEYCLQGDPGFLFLQAGRLFTEMRAILRTVKRAERR
ncbi:MAG: ATP-binding protein [Pseudomonadota bacterium]